MHRFSIHVLFVSAIATLLFASGGCKKAASSDSSSKGDGSSDSSPKGDGISITARLDTGNTGAISGGTLKAPLRRRWNATIPGDLGTPIVSKTAVFVVSSTEIDVQVHGLDVASGADLWPAVQVKNSPSNRVSLAYDDGVLYVMSQSGLVDLWGAAVNAQSGHLLWSRTYEVSFTHPRAIIAVAGGVFFQSTHLTRLDGKTGEVLWTSKGNTNSGIPAVTDDWVYAVGQGCGQKYARDTGEEQWPGQGCAHQAEPMVVGEGLVVAPAKTDAVAVLTGEGLPARELPILGYPVALHGGKVFSALNGINVNPTNGDDSIEAVDAMTGRQVWSSTDVDGVFGGPLVINGLVHSANKAGTFFVHDEQTGVELWTDYVSRAHTQHDPLSPLTTNGDVLVVQGEDGIVAYESDPSPPVDDNTFKSACQASGAHFYVEGLPARVGVGGVSLKDGAFLGSTPVAVDVSSVYSPTSNAISVLSRPDSSGASWKVDLSSDQSLDVGPFVPANVRSTNNTHKTPTTLAVSHSVNSGTTSCEISDGRYEITELQRDTSGIVKLSMNFVYHCNRQAAPTRGCISYSR